MASRGPSMGANAFSSVDPGARHGRTWSHASIDRIIITIIKDSTLCHRSKPAVTLPRSFGRTTASHASSRPTLRIAPYLQRRVGVASHVLWAFQCHLSGTPFDSRPPDLRVPSEIPRSRYFPPMPHSVCPHLFRGRIRNPPAATSVGADSEKFQNRPAAPLAGEEVPDPSPFPFPSPTSRPQNLLFVGPASSQHRVRERETSSTASDPSSWYVVHTGGRYVHIVSRAIVFGAADTHGSGRCG